MSDVTGVKTDELTEDHNKSKCEHPGSKWPLGTKMRTRQNVTI